MGITIHWELSAPPGSAKTVGEKIERVRRACLKLPFKEVGKVEHIPPRTCKVVPKRTKRKDEVYWAVFCARKHVPTGRGYHNVKPLEVVRLPLLAGEECDTTDRSSPATPARKAGQGRATRRRSTPRTSSSRTCS